MRITITGPRSVGKTTTAILLAEQLGLEYVSGDEIMDRLLQTYGGLSKCLRDKRSDIINQHIKPRTEEALKEDGIVFDQAGGSLYAPGGVGEWVRAKITEKGLVIGLLPSMNDEQAAMFLYQRERIRPHFEHLTDEELKAKVKRNYRGVKDALKLTTKNIIYTARLTPQQVVDRCKEFL